MKSPHPQVGCLIKARMLLKCMEGRLERSLRIHLSPLVLTEFTPAESLLWSGQIKCHPIVNTSVPPDVESLDRSLCLS